MKRLGRHRYALIAQACKACGTYDPDVIMGMFEEHLTLGEASLIRAFLGWCHDMGKTFGHGNYEERWAEWRATQ
jgi:hypothetical protein